MANKLVKKTTSEAIAAAVDSGAEVYHGSEKCKQKFLELLQEMELPRGLLPVQEIEEFGYARNTGFVWMKRSKKFEYRYKTLGNLASYGPEVTAHVERRKMKKISGVKVREMLVWFSVSELRIDDPASGMVYCKADVGAGKNVPIKSYEEEYDKYMS